MDDIDFNTYQKLVGGGINYQEIIILIIILGFLGYGLYLLISGIIKPTSDDIDENISKQSKIAFGALLTLFFGTSLIFSIYWYFKVKKDSKRQYEEQRKAGFLSKDRIYKL